MNQFLKILKRVKPTQFWKIIALGLQNPWFVLPTMLATNKCMAEATHLYGNAHKQNGVANAFRHVYWNYLIAKKCTKWWDDEEYVLRWTKKVTDWHEKSFPNNELAKNMDLHNNEVGRRLFRLYANRPQREVLKIIEEMTKKSVLINNTTDLAQIQHTMVHITEA